MTTPAQAHLCFRETQHYQQAVADSVQNKQIGMWGLELRSESVWVLT